MRGFEGDLVAGNHSLLSSLALPLALNFSIADSPESPPSDYHEGSLRREVQLFDDGMPQAVATTRQVAEMLDTTPTGHCRRESFRDLPTVGFWNPRLKPKLSYDSLLDKVEWGISVRDVEVIRFSPRTSEIELELRENLLVHHGAEGEPVAPIRLEMKLGELLGSLEAFSATPETVGVMMRKHGQEFLTEVTTPSAVSSPLLLRGQVPLSHYW